MSARTGRVWGPPDNIHVPIQGRTRSARAKNPMFAPTAHLNPYQKNPKCWNRYQSHIDQAQAPANEIRAVKNGRIRGQKRRAAWRKGQGAKRLRSRIPGKQHLWARKEEVRKNENGQWEYVD
ncbi:hypothetical protein ACEPPN_012396 [Leptodophora sp. 'Broadleaf-Isolate-01']